MAWKYLNKNPLGKRTGDCVVRAISFAMNLSWGKVYMDLSQKGYDRAEMPSWNSCWWAYLKENGYKRYIIDDDCPTCYTVEDFCLDHPEGTYILFIPHSTESSGHVVTVRNSHVYDTWDSTMETPLVYWTKGEK